MEELELIRKRLSELMRKSLDAPYFIFTDFLGLSEQAAFHEVRRDFPYAKYTLFGGTDGAERVVVRFGNAEEIGYEEPFPIFTLKIEPLSQKFAENGHNFWPYQKTTSLFHRQTWHHLSSRFSHGADSQRGLK